MAAEKWLCSLFILLKAASPLIAKCNGTVAANAKLLAQARWALQLRKTYYSRRQKHRSLTNLSRRTRDID